MAFLLNKKYKFRIEKTDSFLEFFYYFFLSYFSFFLFIKSNRGFSLFNQAPSTKLLQTVVVNYLISNDLRKKIVFNVRHMTKNSFGYGVEIYLLGVYFRVKVNKERNLLLFLLGKAVTTAYKIPVDFGIQIYKKKRTFFVVGPTIQEVMQFVTRLEHLRVANRYHGKGFHITGKIRKLALNDSLKKYKA